MNQSINRLLEHIKIIETHLAEKYQQLELNWYPWQRKALILNNFVDTNGERGSGSDFINDRTATDIVLFESKQRKEWKTIVITNIIDLK